jgi:hypothetical protein
MTHVYLLVTTIYLIWTHFNKPKWFHTYTKFNENIVRYPSHSWEIAERTAPLYSDIFSSIWWTQNTQWVVTRSITKKNAHWWSTIIISTCVINLEKRMLDNILYDCGTVYRCPATCHGGTWGERRYSPYSYITSALDGGEWSASRPGCALPPGKGPPVPIG